MFLKFGYKVFVEQFDLWELVEIVVVVEVYGMESVVMSDYFQLWWYEGGYVLFLLSWMVVVGECISMIQIGMSVMMLIFCYNLVVLVQVFVMMGCFYLG